MCVCVCVCVCVINSPHIYLTIYLLESSNPSIYLSIYLFLSICQAVCVFVSS